MRVSRLSIGLTIVTAVAVVGTAQAESKRKEKRDSNQVVCERQTVLGSRLASRRVCMTRAEWAEQRRSDRELVSRSQTNSCAKGAGR